MILIITHKEDYTTDFVIDKLNQKGITYFRFNCEDYLTYAINVDSAGLFSINGHRSFSSVWYRRTKLPVINCENPSEKLYLLGEVDTFMQDLFGMIDTKWLSSPNAVARAENKMLQLKIAGQSGMKIPATIVTTDKKSLYAFMIDNGRTIIKPLGRGRIDYPDNTSKLVFTNIISHEMIDRIESFILTPAIFQKYIEKECEIRVTVVGKEVFAASVDSQQHEDTQVDWRRRKLKFESYNLPNKLKSQCIDMLEKLSLSFGAFDFIKDRNGEYYFLEVNPNGQWVWIEKDTGLPIADSIIKFLS
jgi:glutathione synthase/RimK-type ligase-like ATP-grasp enzyme